LRDAEVNDALPTFFDTLRAEIAAKISHSNFSAVFHDGMCRREGKRAGSVGAMELKARR
jgi:hypothetical protein